MKWNKGRSEVITPVPPASYEIRNTSYSCCTIVFKRLAERRTMPPSFVPLHLASVCSCVVSSHCSCDIKPGVDFSSSEGSI